MPEGIPVSLRIDPTTGLPGTGQLFTRTGTIIGGPYGSASPAVLGDFTPRYDGIFAAINATGGGFSNAGAPARWGGTLFVSDLSGLDTIKIYDEFGIPVNPLVYPVTPNLAALGVLSGFMSRNGEHFPLEFFPEPVTIGLKGRTTYRLYYLFGTNPNIFFDSSDRFACTLLELR